MRLQGTVEDAFVLLRRYARRTSSHSIVAVSASAPLSAE